MTETLRLWWRGEAFDVLLDLLPPAPDVFGGIAGSLNPVRSSLTGSTNVTGTLASNLNAVTAALTGVSIGGALASTLNAVTAALAGNHALPVTGTQASTLNPVAAVVLGVHVESNNTAGVIQSSLTAVTAALAGHNIFGTQVSELGAVTAALAGDAIPGNTGTIAGGLNPVSSLLEGSTVTVPPTPAEPLRTGGGSLRRRFYTTTKTRGMISER